MHLNSIVRGVLGLLFLVAGSLLTQSSSFAAEHNRLTEKEIAEGWIQLFDGETLFGWKAASKADWKVVDGAIVVTSGEKGLLNTTSQFADYHFKADFRSAKGTNSGIFLRTKESPLNALDDCYELNIAEPSVTPFSTGSFVNRQKTDGDFAKPEQWQSFEVTAQGGHFLVKVDGKLVLDYTDPKPSPRGFIGLQINSGKVEFRNLKLKPLGTKPLFNGKDLSGWKVFPGEKSHFSVTKEGNLNVKNGRGQLESETQFQDFVLQLEVFSNGKHLNSGVFFRCIPGEFWNGYESQIQNGYKDNDRTKPVDCGTGGFYRRQDARKVVADDFKWFSKTLIVTGDHMATWVNGYQVSDWTDPRPENDNPRQGKRLKGGTLAIQGHDPTTDLSFRNIQAVETPGK